MIKTKTNKDKKMEKSEHQIIIDDYRERYLNNKDSIIDRVKHFMDFMEA